MLGKVWKFVFGPSDVVPSRAATADSGPVVVRAPAPTPIQQWIPFDQAVRFGSLELPRGGFYVGRVTGAATDVACAIDPALPFTLSRPDWLGKGIGYWPRYSNLTADERGTFLAFMHSPRRAQGVGLSYVFIYVYQLEQRILRDAPRGVISEAEARMLVGELLGLLEAYGPKSGSVRNYLGELLGVAFLRFPELVVDAPVAHADWSLSQKIGLAAAAKRGPLSSDWAFAWASHYLTAVTRSAWDSVRLELKELFAQRYHTAALSRQLIPNVHSWLRVNYQWAASGHRYETLDCEWQDIAGAAALARPYHELLQSVCDELDGMRKARRPDAPVGETLAAAPAEIAGKIISPQLAAWAATERTRIRQEGPGPRATQALAEALGWIGTAKFGKREATMMAQALQALGLGIEPDPRFGSGTPKVNAELTLFELPAEAERAPSSAFAAAHLMLTAAASVGGSDGLAPAELEAALNGINDHFKLSAGERARLHAVLVSTVAKPVRAGTVQSRVKALPEPQRHALATVLVDIALADGHVSPAEIKLLERFYGALGLDPGSLHADLHHGSLGSTKDPARRAAPPGVAKVHVFDVDAIARKLEETARVQSMLADIFVEEIVVPAPVAAPSSVGATSHDTTERDALALLVGREMFDRSDWESFCATRALLPDAALDALNEWSIVETGEPLLEGDDPLEVNAYARDQLVAAIPTS